MIIPVFVVCARLLFSKVKYNLAEIATSITFMLGQLMLVEILLNLGCAIFPPFYESFRMIIMMAELGMVFILAHKLFMEKWYHAAWKSAFIFMTLFFSLNLF